MYVITVPSHLFSGFVRRNAENYIKTQVYGGREHVLNTLQEYDIDESLLTHCRIYPTICVLENKHLIVIEDHSLRKWTSKLLKKKVKKLSLWHCC